MNSKRNVIYIGVTANLEFRVWQHKNGEGGYFTKKYKCTVLVYYEEFDNIYSAIKREKLLKKWNRQWKLDLIMSTNPALLDLYDDIYGITTGSRI